MSELNAASFEQIAATRENAQAMQELAFQNYASGGLELTAFLGNTANESLAFNVYRGLTSPDSQHMGAYIDGTLQGFMKTGEWRIEDELPFADKYARTRLQALRSSGMIIDPNYKLGIFGLAINQSLASDLYTSIADRFLDTAADRGRFLGMKAVVATFHDNDLTQPIARRHGYEFTGRMAEANGAPGIMQRLYRKPLD